MVTSLVTRRNLRTSPHSQRGGGNLIPTTPLPSFIPFLTASLIQSPGFSQASKYAAKKDESLIQIGLSLSFSLPLCLSFVAYGGLWFVRQSRHHRDPITKAKDTSTLAHTRRHIHRGTFKRNYAYKRLVFWERCPCAFVWNKPSNLKIAHGRRTRDHFSKYEHQLLNKSISKDVSCFRFSGRNLENSVIYSGWAPSMQEDDRVKEFWCVWDQEYNMMLVCSLCFMPPASPSLCSRVQIPASILTTIQYFECH